MLDLEIVGLKKFFKGSFGKPIKLSQISQNMLLYSITLCKEDLMQLTYPPPCNVQT